MKKTIKSSIAFIAIISVLILSCAITIDAVACGVKDYVHLRTAEYADDKVLVVITPEASLSRRAYSTLTYSSPSTR